MYLLIAFLLVPIIEIALFIQIGGLIGLWPTLGIVVMTAIVGSWLMRSQGRVAMARLRSSFSELSDPTEPLADGAMILIAGVLLLTPGFFTDAVGFLLLMPPVRHAVLQFLRARVTVTQFQMGARTAPPDMQSSDIIDGEFEEVQPERKARNGSSGWVEDGRRQPGDQH